MDNLDQTVKFQGERKPLSWMHWKAFWLMLITLGLYRFWFKTNLRKFYWNNTILGDERLEYIGTGGELFKGFLIALCFIVPLQIAIVLGSVTTFSPIIFLIVTIAFLWLGHFASFAGRRYRLNRTLWRGLRFSMGGSGVKYAFRALGWSFVNLISLGLASPWATADLEKYKMQRTHFGDIEGGFHGKPFELFKKLVVILLITIFPLIFAVLYLVSQISFDQWSDILIALRAQDEQSLNEVITNLDDHVKNFGLVMIGALPLFFFFSFVTLPAYIAIVFRWTMNGVSLGEARVKSSFTSLMSYKIWGKFILASMAVSTAVSIVVVVLGLIFVLIFGKMFEGFSQGLGNKTGILIGSFILVGFIYILFFFGTWLFKALLITFSYWRDQANSLTLHNFDALENAVARATDANAIGEGFDATSDIGDMMGL